MGLNVGQEIAALSPMTVKQRKQKYADVFGEDATANNCSWLSQHISWRLQALTELAFGGSLIAR